MARWNLDNYWKQESSSNITHDAFQLSKILFFLRQNKMFSKHSVWSLFQIWRSTFCLLENFYPSTKAISNVAIFVGGHLLRIKKQHGIGEMFCQKIMITTKFTNCLHAPYPKPVYSFQQFKLKETSLFPVISTASSKRSINFWTSIHFI